MSSVGTQEFHLVSVLKFRFILNDQLFIPLVTQLKAKQQDLRATYRTMGVMVRNLRDAVNCTP